MIPNVKEIRISNYVSSIVTSQPIKKGEEILIEYLPEPNESNYVKEKPIEPIMIMGIQA